MFIIQNLETIGTVHTSNIIRFVNKKHISKLHKKRLGIGKTNI